MRSPAEQCPCCFGTGQITGPKSAAYRWGPDDPFNTVVRICDECEGTGVVTAIRAAALRSQSTDHVLAIIDEVCPKLAGAAAEQAAREMRDLGIEDPSGPFIPE